MLSTAIMPTGMTTAGDLITQLSPIELFIIVSFGADSRDAARRIGGELPRTSANRPLPTSILKPSWSITQENLLGNGLRDSLALSWDAPIMRPRRVVSYQSKLQNGEGLLIVSCLPAAMLACRLAIKSRTSTSDVSTRKMRLSASNCAKP